jgi:hypothetical protein
LRAILHATVILMFAFATMRPLRAQEVAAYLGFGSTHVSSTGAQIQTFSDGNLYKTPSLGDFFAHLGGSVFVTKQVGVGAEISWTTSQGYYAGIPYRPMLYNFDAIFRPANLALVQTRFVARLAGLFCIEFPQWVKRRAPHSTVPTWSLSAS